MKNFEKRINLVANEKITITFDKNTIELTGPGSLQLYWNDEKDENVFDALLVKDEL